MRFIKILLVCILLFSGACIKKESPIDAILSNIDKELTQTDRDSLSSLSNALLKEKNPVTKDKFAQEMEKFGRKAIPYIHETYLRTTIRTDNDLLTRNIIAKMLSKSDEGIAILKEYTKADSGPNRNFGLTGLVDTGKKDIFYPYLFSALKDDYEQNRKYAFSTLAEQNDRSIVPQLIEALDDDSYGVRLECANILRKYDVKESLPKLKEAFAKEKNRKDTKRPVQIIIAGSILGLGDESTKDYLINTFTNSTDLTTEDIGFLSDALKGVKDKRVIKKLIDILPSDDLRQRNIAIMWLYTLTGEKLDFKSRGSLESRQAAVENWKKWFADNFK